MAKEKKDKKALKNAKKDIWNNYSASEKKALEKLCLNYRHFLSKCKTERECVKEIIFQAQRAGYRDLKDIITNKETLQAGDKVYSVCMNKSVVLFNIGSEPMENGMNILGAHIDSPRLDIKQNPLYEDGGLAYMDTHYYGGIKKYQWVTVPLAIHGVVAKKDGTIVDINIGEDDNDPVFCVTDLLIHLAQEQMQKNAAKVIEGENLDILVGSIPLDGSTDVGNVSHVTRTCQPTICIGNNLFVHTLEFANASGSEYAKKQALIGAKAMAMTAIDVLFEK
jgi:aspartyl aminopeptidase